MVGILHRTVRTARAVQRDESGTGLIELALMAPVLALLTVGIVDLTQGFTRRMELHDAVHRTVEKVSARNFKVTVTDGVVNGTALKADAAEAADVEPSEVTVTGWVECDGVQQPNYSDACPALSSPDPQCSTPNPPPGIKCAAIKAKYLRVRIDTTYNPTFGKVVSAKPDGTVDLFAEAAVRVE